MGDAQLQVTDPNVALLFLEWLPGYPEPAAWPAFVLKNPWVNEGQLRRVVLRLVRSGVIVNGYHPGADELATQVRWPRPRPPTAPERCAAPKHHDPHTTP
jgi:hypothetical protein